MFWLLQKLRSLFLCSFGIKTVGAHALVIQNDQILLIKHTYQKGWYTIGGIEEYLRIIPQSDTW